MTLSQKASFVLKMKRSLKKAFSSKFKEICALFVAKEIFKFSFNKAKFQYNPSFISHTTILNLVVRKH